MTPTQQTALEALAGRPLTQAEIALGEGREDASLAYSLSIGRTEQIPVPRSVFAMWAGATGLRAAIQDAASAVGNPLRSSALTLLDFLQGGVATGIELNRPENQAMMAAWVSAGAITSEQVAQLQEFAVQAAAIISLDDVSNALNLAQ